ncbi:MAG: UdgX family uracil-DNA binding protein [Rhizobiales bacterium]|nr:UdgX family uracil-DNA binding protein [Hyphomicrobiales bacterium]
MLEIGLPRPHDIAEFRDAARRLLAQDVAPQDVIWRDGRENGLFSKPALPVGCPVSVPSGFVPLAEDVICHKDAGRLGLLYELLWRLTHGERHLLRVAADPLVHRLLRMQKTIAREVHKMHAFVRFRRVEPEEGKDGERFVAWFEPEHHVLDRAAPFFVDRFSAMRWSILTPIGLLHWTGEALLSGPAAPRENAPAGDDLDDWWRTYWRATFNPARVNPDMMRAEMPKRYWRNLPEATLIPELLADAQARSAGMMAAAPTVPRKLIRAPSAAIAPTSDAAPLAEIAREAAGCQRCPLFAPATQTVFGAGPPLATGGTARIMMVGEQPGDHEDLQGLPFVGPAGQLLDRALEEAGINRGEVYVTNAVKHFKFEARGKRRIHKKPDRPEIEACRWWLERELAVVKPDLVVALGGTAGQAIHGRAVKVMSERGTIGDDPRGFRVLLTVHPSYLLRLCDAAAKEREYLAFVADLKLAA